MLKKLLSKEEGKILEFKENTQSLQKIIQTIIAFANTTPVVDKKTIKIPS